MRLHPVFFILALGLLATLPLVVSITALAAEATTKPPPKPPLPPDIAAKFYAASINLKDQLLEDYRNVLSVYYELKKKSANPTTFRNYDYDPALAASLPESARSAFLGETVSHVSEFDYEMYLEFKTQIDTDPRLAGNTYMKRMRDYGSGRANDVFQRIHGYASESVTGLNDILLKQARKDIGTPVLSLALFEAKDVFNEVSVANGYPKNRAEPDFESEKYWRDLVQAKGRELKAPLTKIGFNPDSSRPKPPECAAAFANFAK